ncbi:MAG: ATP-binding protein [Spirochaetales bacterium]|nr:ATP-binding protein [Spirochaetales bacterium]
MLSNPLAGKPDSYHGNRIRGTTAVQNEKSVKPAYYKDSSEHLTDELRRIDILIHNCIARLRKKWQEKSPGQEMPFVLEMDTDIPGKNKENDKPEYNDSITLTQISPACTREFREKIAAKITAGIKQGNFLSIPHLRTLFRLTPLEQDCLLICLAVELDVKYERLFAYIHNDVNKREPTVGLIREILFPSMDEHRTIRALLSPGSPLIRYNLLTMQENIPGIRTPFISTNLKIDERIIDYILDLRGIDRRLEGFTERIYPSALSMNGLPLIHKDNIKNIIRNIKGDKNREHIKGNCIFIFKGMEGTGQRETAVSICRKLGLGLLVVSTGLMLESRFPLSQLLSLLTREAVLCSGALYFTKPDPPTSNQGKAHLHPAHFKGALAEFTGILFFEADPSWDSMLAKLPGHRFYLDFYIPCVEVRKKIWDALLENIPGKNNINTMLLSEKFALTGGQITESINLTLDQLFTRETSDHTLCTDDFFAGCRARSNQKLSTLSQKIIPRYNWNDIILPPMQLNLLREISSYMRYRHKVYGEWEFDKKLSLGIGLNVLFFGISGTGKTMAAEIIAHELHLDMYKINLATIISKYIGETEKNLNRIFTEAETSNGILFFDEADALFGKRSEVKDSHDRYANIEVAYLLQKMEEYHGTVILATNIKKNMDQAFTRRMHFTVEFPFPEEEERYGIWRQIFPDRAPMEEEIDYRFLAKKFKFTGGNIKNTAVCAAFLAAEAQEKIGMRHLILAVKRELRKIGKLSTSNDFENYQSFLSEE